MTNWPEYEAGLRRRGSLMLWVTEEALAGWQAPRRTTRGGQPRYSNLAIETVLTLGCVFGLRLRQSEGLMLSLLDLMGLDLPVPDHTTLSRRAQTWEPSAGWQRHPEDGPLHVLVDSTGLKVFGAGQWLGDKHGVRSRRTWRKLHLALDADSGEIVAHRLTDQDTDDPSQVMPPLDRIDGEIGQFRRTALMMAVPPTAPSCNTAPPHGLSFPHVSRRWRAVQPDHPAKEMITSGRLPMTEG